MRRRIKSCKVMLDAVLSRIAEAGGHIERGEVQAKGEKIGKALGIIEALMLGLDKDEAATSPPISSACTTTRRARCSKHSSRSAPTC